MENSFLVTKNTVHTFQIMNISTDILLPSTWYRMPSTGTADILPRFWVHGINNVAHLARHCKPLQGDNKSKKKITVF